MARVETWQRLLAMTDDAQLPRQRAATAARVEPLRAEILAIQTQLEEISVSCGRAVTGAAQAGCPDEHYLSGLFPWSPMHDPRSPALLQRVSQLHGRLMQILQDSLPPTPSQAHSRRHNQVSLAWDTVLNSVRELMQTLRFALLSQPWRLPRRSLLDALRQQWNTAQQQYSGRRSAILRSRSQTGMALNLHLRPGRSLGVFHWTLLRNGEALQLALLRHSWRTHLTLRPLHRLLHPASMSRSRPRMGLPCWNICSPPVRRHGD